MFVQAGIAQDAKTVVAGATWWSAWRTPLAGGEAAIYWEATLGRWSSEPDDSRHGSALVTQIGLTPVLRWQPADERFFLEAGIGANLLLPIYRSREKRFSTAFNFGDHIAIGKRLGDANQHEVSLRLQHFSNAGIKEPNPGEDFLQLRYSHRF